MDSIHKGHRQRLKERFLQEGLDNFSDVNILELLLFYAVPRRDTSPIAHALLSEFGSLKGVLEASPEALCRVPGLGESAATLLRMLPQLLRRYLQDAQKLGEILPTTTACGQYLLPRFFLAGEEQAYLLCLDAKCQVLDCRCLQRGNINSVGLSIRRIVELALHTRATSVVLAHNHTSGLALPSEADLLLTKRVSEALDAVNVVLADHIIVAGDDFVSMMEGGQFRQLGLRMEDAR